jgi:hypothetical protein
VVEAGFVLPNSVSESELSSSFNVLHHEAILTLDIVPLNDPRCMQFKSFQSK